MTSSTHDIDLPEKEDTNSQAGTSPCCVLSVAIPPLPTPLSYQLGEIPMDQVPLGTFVQVPLGRRIVSGFVVGMQNESLAPRSYELKSIVRVLGSGPCFLPSQLSFFEWVANYYGEPFSNVIETAVPSPSQQRFTRHISLVMPLPSIPPKGRLQENIYQYLISCSPEAVAMDDLVRRFRGAAGAIARLHEKKFVQYDYEEILDRHLKSFTPSQWAKSSVELLHAQEEAVQLIGNAVKDHRFFPVALHGVTGSGKTEVYLEVIRETLALGKTALVIVPEIALTPQLVDRFQARFGNEIAVLHSGLNRTVRWDAWRAVLEGRHRIAIGARSGIFAPMHDLGVIVVDEEHDGSFKQGEGMRYNGRDLAVARAKLESCPVILGSATLSLETFHHSYNKKYHYLSLPVRFASAPKLNISIVDLNQVKPWESPSRNISPRLHEEIARTIERNEQVFILYNRRGFSNYLQCDTCHRVLECKRCSVTLTFHKKLHSLVCHYCGFTTPVIEQCPQCPPREQEKEKPQPPGKLLHRGGGTEKVFEELIALFPNARIDRLDRDVAQQEREYREILDRVRSQETDILVGTQMIAKGHDLPGVTLVGVVDSDVGLHMPDFRASERTYQLLTQVAGRAGRADKPGRVILQTRQPNHPSIVFTQLQDYEGFARSELEQRRLLGYPPFSRLLRIVVSASDKQKTIRVLQDLKDTVKDLISQEKLPIHILGPAPAPLAKLKSLHRAHLLFKSANPKALHRILTTVKNQKRSSRSVKIVFDMDPVDML